MIPSEIGAWVRTLRKSHGLTLEDLAFRTGVTPGALSHIENGRRLPSPQVAVSIAEVLGQPAEEALQLLDLSHGTRRREMLLEEDASVPRAPASASAAPPASPASRKPFWAKRDIGELFGAPSMSSPQNTMVPPPSMPAPSASVAPMRDTARWSPDADERLRALERLADTASDAIRTLRGMLADEDPLVRREARRLLAELDVRVDE